MLAQKAGNVVLRKQKQVEKVSLSSFLQEDYIKPIVTSAPDKSFIMSGESSQNNFNKEKKGRGGDRTQTLTKKDQECVKVCASN